MNQAFTRSTVRNGRRERARKAARARDSARSSRAGRNGKRPSVSRGRRRARVDLAYAREVLRAEAFAVASLCRRVDAPFREAAEWILALGADGRGRVVATGMGKAGLVAQKVCATLASTGTPALFLHPAEALHGDLGMVAEHDVLLAFSHSGESEELLRLLPALKRSGARVIAITARADSPLGRAADLALTTGRIQEPCPLQLAPSASTTAMLAFGDALALCVLKARGFTAQDYARLHPGGALGRGLREAADLMRTGERLPRVKPHTKVGEALARMSRARGGTAVVVDRGGKLLGVFTDGDFRRLMVRDPGLFHDEVGRHMTSPCQSIPAATRALEARARMAERKINALPVTDGKGNVVGLLDIQDLVGVSERGGSA